MPIAAITASAFAALQKRGRVGQHIRPEGPQGHLSKGGTPTMGGVVVVALWGGSLLTLHLVDPLPGRVWWVFFATLAYAGIGLADDLLSLARGRSRGLAAPTKILLGLGAAGGLLAAHPAAFDQPQLIPFSAHPVLLPIAATVALVLVVFVATTNSMNLADGLDGLATGLSAIILAALVIARPENATAVAVLPLLGVLAGFLWVNAYPSRLFLGDVGAYALGGTVAAIVLIEGLALVLPLLAGVLVLEATSVLAQVTWYHATGRRLLRMSPLHHHFEQSVAARPHRIPGPLLPEPAITVRFWLLQALFAAIAVIAMTR
jgi:phospho-N-acetylmuramoyl-pentapeptide-transferase